MPSSTRRGAIRRQQTIHGCQQRGYQTRKGSSSSKITPNDAGILQHAQYMYMIILTSIQYSKSPIHDPTSRWRAASWRTWYTETRQTVTVTGQIHGRPTTRALRVTTLLPSPSSTCTGCHTHSLSAFLFLRTGQTK